MLAIAAAYLLKIERDAYYKRKVNNVTNNICILAYFPQRFSLNWRCIVKKPWPEASESWSRLRPGQTC
jgi:hypothetical protein